jgi:hypothetical protein
MTGGRDSSPKGFQDRRLGGNAHRAAGNSY